MQAFIIGFARSRPRHAPVFKPLARVRARTAEIRVGGGPLTRPRGTFGAISRPPRRIASTPVANPPGRDSR